MRKLICVFCFALLVGAGAFAKDIVNVGILNGPTSIPAAYIIEKKPDLGGGTASFKVFADPQALLPKMLKGEIDIGFMPANVAAKVYNSTNGKIICAGISGNGNLFLVTKDRNLKSMGDLLGKKVSMAGQGATPEYMFKYLLGKSEIPYDVRGGVALDYSIPTPNIAAEMISGNIAYALLPEPFASVAQMKDKSVIRAIDIQDEFESVQGKGKTYPLTVIVTRKEFADKNRYVLDNFLSKFSEAVDWTVKNPGKSGELNQKHTLGLQAGVVAASIPKANYVFIPATDGREDIEFLLGIFLKASPESIGGKLPGNGFYLK